MIKAVLLDLGGVVYVGDEALPGSVAAVGRLRAAGLAVRFLTNVTRQPRRGLLAKLRRIGLEIDQDEIFMPSIAARQYLERHDLKPHLLIHPALEEDFAGTQHGAAEAVVVGDAGEDFTYASLNRAFRVLSRGAPLIALACNRTFRDADGELSLDTGAFVAALEYASGQQAVVLGKPSADFFRAALDSAGSGADQAVMVGDDAEFDVAAAQAAGIPGVLVRTGKYRPGTEQDVAPPPAAVADDLAAAADWILARKDD